MFKSNAWQLYTQITNKKDWSLIILNCSSTNKLSVVLLHLFFVCQTGWWWTGEPQRRIRTSSCGVTNKEWDEPKHIWHECSPACGHVCSTKARANCCHKHWLQITLFQIGISCNDSVKLCHQCFWCSIRCSREAFFFMLSTFSQSHKIIGNLVQFWQGKVGIQKLFLQLARPTGS